MEIQGCAIPGYLRELNKDILFVNRIIIIKPQQDFKEVA